MDQSWLEIAHYYGNLSEAERSVYWNGLTPDQRSALEHALRQLQPMSPSSTNTMQPSASRGCGCGCGKFFGKGCLTFLIIIVVLTLLNNLPWFARPATDRFDLWPDSTLDALSFFPPIEPIVSDLEKSQDYEVTFFPAQVLSRWLKMSKIDVSDVSEVAFLNVVQDGGGWWYKDLEFGYNEITSAIAIVKLSKHEPDVLQRLPALTGTHTTIEGKPAIAFDNPFPWLEQERRRMKRPAIEPWYMTMVDQQTVIIGGRTAVEYVLNTASGSRDAITSRPVLRPLLKDMESFRTVRAYFVSPTKEKAIPGVQAVMQILTTIPGLDLVYTYRARAFGFSSLPDGRCTRTVAYQYKTRDVGFIHTAFLRTGTAEGYVVHGGNGLAVFTEPVACADILGGSNHH
jgi:hypothetical protein